MRDQNIPSFMRDKKLGNSLENVLVLQLIIALDTMIFMMYVH